MGKNKSTIDGLEKFATALLTDKKLFREYINVLEKTVIKCIEMQIKEWKEEQHNEK